MEVQFTNVETGTVITAGNPTVLVGSSPHADVHVEDVEVRPYQCMIDTGLSGPVVWDLGTGPCLEVHSTAELSSPGGAISPWEPG